MQDQSSGQNQQSKSKESQSQSDQESQNQSFEIPDNILDAIVDQVSAKFKAENDELREQLAKKNSDTSGIQNLLDHLGVKSPANKHQSHGLTVAEMEQRKLRQASGIKLTKDDMILATDGKTLIDPQEKHMVIVYMEQVETDNKGKIISPPGFTRKFYPNDFEAMSENKHHNHFGNFDIIRVINDPRPKVASSKKSKSIERTPDLTELTATYKRLYDEDAPAEYGMKELLKAIEDAKS